MAAVAHGHGRRCKQLLPFRLLVRSLIKASAAQNTNLILELPGCDLFLLAKDGVYINDMPRNLSHFEPPPPDSRRRRTEESGPPPPPSVKGAAIFLSPANRADVAVRCPAGSYTLATVVPAEGPPAGQPIFPGPDGANMSLATVVASPPTHSIAPVELTPFAPHRPSYLRDLYSLEDSAIAGRETISLINNGPEDLTFNGGKCRPPCPALRRLTSC